MFFVLINVEINIKGIGQVGEFFFKYEYENLKNYRVLWLILFLFFKI